MIRQEECPRCDRYASNCECEVEKTMTSAEAWGKIVAESTKNWGDTLQFVDGVPFVKVGRNASHDFMVGFWNNVFIIKAVGESYEKGKEEPIWVTSYSIKHDVDELYRSYLGHL